MLIYSLDLFGTFVFAISGTLAVTEKRLDFLGAFVMGFVTAVGGGTVRDMLLNVSPGWLTDLNYFYIILAAVVLSFLAKTGLQKLRKAFFLFDSLGIAVFTVIGLEKALHYEIALPIAILMGVMSAVTGGALRDVLTNEIPLIFRKEIYATACVLGAVLFLILQKAGVNPNFNLLLTATLITLIRIVSVKYNLALPTLKPDRKGSKKV
ncbi:MAG TPA: hypothetical protein DCQ31_11345 [Bacteroidales bacterium]|nr:hypothetical protein [Bacteroidales bacterium]